MSEPLQEYHGQWTPLTSWCSGTVGGVAWSITVQKYFLCKYNGESSNQLCEALQAAFVTAGYGSATVTYNRTTGRVTIYLDASPVAVVWGNVYMAYALGFAGNLSGAGTYVAPNAPRYVWRPSLSLSSYPFTLDDWFVKASTARVIRAPDGTCTSVVPPGELLEGEYEYQLLPIDEVKIDLDYPLLYNNLQQFFNDCILTGSRIRVYPDRSDDTNHYSGFIFKGDGSVGAFTEFMSRRLSNYNGLWNFNFRMWGSTE